MVLRRIADALDRNANTTQRTRSVLQTATIEFLDTLPKQRGHLGGNGSGGCELSNLCQAAFWTMAILSHNHEKLTIQLLKEIHPEKRAYTSYEEEKVKAEDILKSIGFIEPDSLIGFVDIAIYQFQPNGNSGEPLIPQYPATEILKSVLLRGAITGELCTDQIQDAWYTAHAASRARLPIDWEVASSSAERLYQNWRLNRKTGRRFFL